MFALCVEKFQYFFSGLTEIDLNKGLNMASANFHAPYLLHPFEQLFLCDEGNRSVRPKKEKKNFSLFFACNSMLQNRSSHSLSKNLPHLRWAGFDLKLVNQVPKDFTNILSANFQMLKGDTKRGN